MALDEIMGELAQYIRMQEEAAEIVEFWNAGYKANGTYLFSSPAF